MFNILVTGANGQVGQEIQELSANYPYTFFFTGKNKLDITDAIALENFITLHNIHTIINCAAYTAVDKAETEKKRATDINSDAVRTLATISAKNNIKLIHISTDYVFDGLGYLPYDEEHSTNPISIYGQTKREGELAILDVNPANSIIIRTSWLYSSYGANFVKTMLRLGKERESLGVVYDQIGSPTYAKDLAYTILEIIPHISNENVPIYHYSNEGVASWYDLAKEIMYGANLSCTINPITTLEYPTPAKRPYYSVFNKHKIKKDFGIKIPYWKDSLKACLAKIGNA